MTDPKDAKPNWPNGLKRILDETGAHSLVEAVRKKVKPKDKSKPAPRLPYKDLDEVDEPD